MSSGYLLKGVMGIALAAGVIGIAVLGIAFFWPTSHPFSAPGFACVIAGAFSGLLLTQIRRAN
jgi:hypothetical protein